MPELELIGATPLQRQGEYTKDEMSATHSTQTKIRKITFWSGNLKGRDTDPQDRTGGTNPLLSLGAARTKRKQKIMGTHGEQGDLIRLLTKINGDTQTDRQTAR